MARYGSTAVMDADRDAATAQLREHYAVGRLSLDQFQDRLDEAYRAQTVRELGAATDGLPHVGQVIPSGAPRGSYPGGYPFNAGHIRTALARTGRRILLAFGALTVGGLLVLALLITAFLGAWRAARHRGCRVARASRRGRGRRGCPGVVGPASVAAARLDRGRAAGSRTAVAEPRRADGPPAAHWPRPLAAAYPPGLPRLTIAPATTD